ncbi:phosphotransferase [Nocardioides campestrisoli]|uniref:phosphotransferase n=1 Tax=Nocardioides campestrisoli TaxID=2736757 RepID=UPI0015E71B00|nr:phosphotransferase [Nocardioides campestrisoli]
MTGSLAALSAVQRDLLCDWLPGFQIVRDHGWGLIESSVLEVAVDSERYIVKAGGETNHHIGRELDAHERWLSPWTSSGRAPRLVAGDRAARILVTQYLPGDLVLGSPAQEDPQTFRQAGALLAGLHAQVSTTDDEYESRENAKVLKNLDKPHRIAPDVESRLRAVIGSWATQPVTVVPTHGDWSPRNWLADAGTVRLIDFGRAAMRPALTDWLRVGFRDFWDDPAREAAFVEGYGSDPREPEAWLRAQLREAVNTAVWAHLVGDEEFEAEGHAWLGRVLAEV